MLMPRNFKRRNSFCVPFRRRAKEVLDRSGLLVLVYSAENKLFNYFVVGNECMSYLSGDMFPEKRLKDSTHALACSNVEKQTETFDLPLTLRSKEYLNILLSTLNSRFLKPITESCLSCIEFSNCCS